jgi:hypothetical protein
MRGSPPRGQTWGNSFLRDPHLQVNKAAWTCVELMMKMNDVGDSNGEMALWIDGKRVSHLGRGFPKGKWVFDQFLPGQGGEGARWNDEKAERESFQVPPGGQPFEGFRWRRDEKLKLNFLWVLVYITKAPRDHVSKVWLDQIVVARQYIGPLEDPKPPKDARARIGSPIKVEIRSIDSSETTPEWLRIERGMKADELERRHQLPELGPGWGDTMDWGEVR